MIAVSAKTLPPGKLAKVLLPAKISRKNLAHSLALVNRWAGNTYAPYSVAQHSVGVAEIMAQRVPNDPRAPLYGLLHDAHEALIGDVPVPLTLWIDHAAGEGFMDSLKEVLDAHLMPLFGLPWPMSEDIAQALWIADRAMGAAEIRCIVADKKRVTPPKVPARKRAIGKCWPWGLAEEKFLEAWNDYAIAAGPLLKRDAR